MSLHPETQVKSPHSSWIKARVESLSPKQRKRAAVAVVTLLALVALLWGLKVYVLPQYRLKLEAGTELSDVPGDGNINLQPSHPAWNPNARSRSRPTGQLHRAMTKHLHKHGEKHFPAPDLMKDVVIGMGG